jgi:hypothetical protein
VQAHITNVFFSNTTPALSKLLKLSKPPTPHDRSRFCVQSNQPSPELLNHVGHALLRSVAIGQGDILRSAAGALERLADLLPDASPEGRMIAVLLAISSEPTPREETMVQSPTPTPTPTPSRRQAKAGKPAKQARKSKAATPTTDIHGKIISSKEIDGIAVISQAQARKVLGMNCPQMIKLENQRLLTRIQESGSRLVYYPVAEAQKLLDLIDATPPPPL